MASHLSTKEYLLNLVDDIELIAKEIIENSIAPKPQKMSAAEHTQITELLLAKNAELLKTLELAEEQAKIDEKMNRLKMEVDNQDQDICQLQRQLKEAEQILATALYQARQKLASIMKSRRRPVPSEELIKFAHRISASNAICAPLSWQPGDPRRPYPTDIEMRLGLLGRLCDLPLNGHAPSLSDLHRLSTGEVPASGGANQFAWHPSGGDMHASTNSLNLNTGGGGGSTASSVSGLEGGATGGRHNAKDTSQEDVEVKKGSPRPGSSGATQIASGDSKKETEEILNAILPPKEWEENGQIWIQEVSSTPATRLDVLNLQETLDTRLQQRQARETGICPVRRQLYTQCFDELIRQVTINCADRGLLLLRVRDELKMTMEAYETLYCSSIAFGMRKALQSEQGKEDLIEQVEKLDKDRDSLEKQCAELKLKSEQLERRAAELRAAEEKKNQEKIKALEKTNQQLKAQLEGIIAPKK